MRPEFNKRINLLLTITFIFGIALSIQMKTISDKTAFINVESVNEMELQLKIEQAEIENLENYLERKNKELLEYKLNPETKDIILVMQTKLEEYKKINAEYDLVGQGIMVEVRDSEKLVKPGENPNDFLVHDQDLLRIINDLKIAGAEAISINGQRYMGFSEVKCSGPTVTINGKTYGQPFIIKAIGNSAELESAIKSIDSYSYMLNSIYGIKIDVKASNQIKVPKYTKLKQYNYLQEITEESK